MSATPPVQGKQLVVYKPPILNFRNVAAGSSVVGFGTGVYMLFTGKHAQGFLAIATSFQSGKYAFGATPEEFSLIKYGHEGFKGTITSVVTKTLAKHVIPLAERFTKNVLPAGMATLAAAVPVQSAASVVGNTLNRLLSGTVPTLKETKVAAITGSVGAVVGLGVEQTAGKVIAHIFQEDTAAILNGGVTGGLQSGTGQLTANALSDKPLSEEVVESMFTGVVLGIVSAIPEALHRGDLIDAKKAYDEAAAAAAKAKAEAEAARIAFEKSKVETDAANTKANTDINSALRAQDKAHQEWKACQEKCNSLEIKWKACQENLKALEGRWKAHDKKGAEIADKEGQVSDLEKQYQDALSRAKGTISKHAPWLKGNKLDKAAAKLVEEGKITLAKKIKSSHHEAKREVRLEMKPTANPAPLRQKLNSDKADHDKNLKLLEEDDQKAKNEAADISAEQQKAMKAKDEAQQADIKAQDEAQQADIKAQQAVIKAQQDAKKPIDIEPLKDANDKAQKALTQAEQQAQTANKNHQNIAGKTDQITQEHKSTATALRVTTRERTLDDYVVPKGTQPGRHVHVLGQKYVLPLAPAAAQQPVATPAQSRAQQLYNDDEILDPDKLSDSPAQQQASPQPLGVPPNAVQTQPQVIPPQPVNPVQAQPQVAPSQPQAPANPVQAQAKQRNFFDWLNDLDDSSPWQQETDFPAWELDQFFDGIDEMSDSDQEIVYPLPPPQPTALQMKQERTTNQIDRLEEQREHCVSGKKGRAKSRSLSMQIQVQKERLALLKKG